MPIALIWSRARPARSRETRKAGLICSTDARGSLAGIDAKAFEGQQRPVAGPIPSWSLVPPISMPSNAGFSHAAQRAPAPFKTASLAEKRR